MMGRRSSFGSAMRKRLSDITNLQFQNKSPAKFKENSLAIVDEISTKNYIEQLVKENAVMMKLVQERDKLIESTGLEMQKLKTRLQKTQLLNWNLAQSNSQMLAELNMSKDRLKTAQHELACKETLYKAKILELEEKVKTKCRPTGSQEREGMPNKETADRPLAANKINIEESKLPKKEAADCPVEAANDNGNKAPKVKRTRPGPARSRSMGAMTSQQSADKEMVENKRRCLRRQSVLLKPQQEPQDLFEIDVANFPMSHLMDDSPKRSSANKAGEEEGLRRSSNASEPQRSSLGRPMRRAAEKVQSYKEVPLNVKMRRPE